MLVLNDYLKFKYYLTKKIEIFTKKYSKKHILSKIALPSYIQNFKTYSEFSSKKTKITINHTL
ncbi:hypothetical protein BpHYR1_046677 [Brachionus plicatilis]|uniref:Uncharacterized protein n=1 Tax=Brachionus plicatilis TaxID=10195 RepID=A0A3M7RVE6_BRAPC|nr:hypothetical protein BpHYR1_046677 [Brachionus plicatilis]